MNERRKSPIDEILESGDNFPIRIMRGGTGETFVVIKPCDNQEFFVGRFIAVMGEPNEFGPLLDEETREPTGMLYLIFPHQNIPEGLMPLVEACEKIAEEGKDEQA